MGYITTVMPAEARKKAGPKSGAIASATVSVDLLGGVVVTVASTPAGQGHMTVCAQVVADVLGLDPKDIVVNVEFDTHKDAWSVAAGNYSSRFAGAVAGTVHLAAMRVRDKLSRIVAKQFDCTPEEVCFDAARIYPKGAEDRATAVCARREQRATLGARAPARRRRAGLARDRVLDAAEHGSARRERSHQYVGGVWLCV